MAYEKKIEPFQRWEAFMSGISLQIFLILITVLPLIAWGKNDCADTILKGDISWYDDVVASHNCMIEHRNGMLGGSTCLLLAYPFIITHLYYQHRVYETIKAFLDTGLMEAMYTLSWIIGTIIMCIILPALGIFTIGNLKNHINMLDMQCNSNFYILC